MNVREIKFRAWDKLYKVMREVLSIDLEKQEAICPPRGHEFSEWYNQHLSFNEVLLLQYTGLKDKNGKEIYEGDVVKVPCDIEDSIHGEYSFQEIVYRNGTWIVQYLKSETGFKLPRGYTGGLLIDLYDHDMKSLVFNDDRLEHTNIEVIGNIFEVPELINS